MSNDPLVIRYVAQFVFSGRQIFHGTFRSHFLMSMLKTRKNPINEHVCARIKKSNAHSRWEGRRPTTAITSRVQNSWCCHVIIIFQNRGGLHQSLSSSEQELQRLHPPDGDDHRVYSSMCENTNKSTVDPVYSFQYFY